TSKVAKNECGAIDVESGRNSVTLQGGVLVLHNAERVSVEVNGRESGSAGRGAFVPTKNGDGRRRKAKRVGRIRGKGDGGGDEHIARHRFSSSSIHQDGPELDCQRAAPQKKQKPGPVQFNRRYADKNFQAAFREAFVSGQDFRDEPSRSTVVGAPFASGLLRDVFDAEFLRNDLYEFYQSEDLRLVEAGPLALLREAIYSPEFVAMFAALTGLELNDTVDLSAHRYPDKGCLLCHDDDIGNQTEGRRIAFILYLVEEDWSEKDGGRLDLFDKLRADDNNQPRHVARSIVPAFNSLAFFAVGDTSYHQVSEVMGGRERLSVSGWFHGPFRKRAVVDRPLRLLASSSPAHRLDAWINPVYLSTTSRSGISDTFVDTSSARLLEFLRADVYERLLRSLRDARWGEPVGPASVRRYACAKEADPPDSGVAGRPAPSTGAPERRSGGFDADGSREDAEEEKSDADDLTGEVPPFWARLRDFFRSREFAGYLGSLTELKLASSYAEVRKFGCGDYTLLHDHAQEPEGLDLVFSCTEATAEDSGAGAGDDCGAWDASWGGALHYVSGDENLLALQPGSNTLDLVYRIQPAQRFVKYVNHTARAERRELAIVYAVVEDECEN
ncbi:MAG: Oxoglutarate and iron-dependent oxygenase degradation C-term-domain-containing protein, partial [Olpidium bornovanus]